MLTRCALILLLAIPGGVVADAGNGDFMGYQLGDQYQPGPDTRQQTSTTGNLLISAEQPIKPGDIAQVTLLATAETLTIGYIGASQWFATEGEARAMGRRYFELLQAKYPDWPYGWEVMDARMNVVEVNFNSAPYNLRLRLTEDQHEGEQMWRFSMTLGWLPGSPEEEAWRNQAVDEQIAEKLDTRQELLKKSDVRGL
jgi:hypothetical protein